jgi:hypothetical protein
VTESACKLPRALIAQEDLDAVGSPSSKAATEEVEASLRFRLVFSIDVDPNQIDKTHHSSSTSALFDIPLLRAGSLLDLFVFTYEFVFGGAP